MKKVLFLIVTLSTLLLTSCDNKHNDYYKHGCFGGGVSGGGGAGGRFELLLKN